MSLKKFRRPSLLSKLEEERDRLEQGDQKKAKIIKKSAKKK